MADLLAPGLWWLHGTRGSNVYLVESDDGQLALVDTGFSSSAEAIIDAEIVSRGRVKNLREQVGLLIQRLEQEIENTTP